MEKEFIPYELALRMKQLGFDEPCLSYYEGESFSYHLASIKGDDYIIPAPLFQQVFRWFRDSHGLWVNKTVNFHSEDNLIRGYHYNIHQAKDFIVDLNKSVEFWYFGISEEKPEITCIEKLIEIVEQNELNKQSN